MRTADQRHVVAAFHNRGGGHDDVVWEQRGSDGFISSHRVLNTATHNGFWTYGPPTGKEWVIRDEFAVLQDLGLDPFAIAAQLARNSPVLGEEMGDGSAGAFAGSFPDPVPDGQVTIRDFSTHWSPDLGLRVAAIWLMRGTYSGVPAYGPVNKAPVAILGSSHFEIQRGKIIREWRMFDEIALIAQILREGS